VTVPLETDPDVVSRFLEDAAHYPGGNAAGVLRPRSVAEVSACLRERRRILPVGAQSSLTGGATPLGDVVLSTERLTTLAIEPAHIRAGAGVTLEAVQRALERVGRWFPPVPTYLGATVGGAIATCAAGAATFKYGSVRPWVDAITVVLAGGDILQIKRGEVFASADGIFEITAASGTRTVRIPPLEMPAVEKHSAGYYCAPEMDLIDLFIGSEGTLGVVAEAVLRTAPERGPVVRALVQLSSEAEAMALVDHLRNNADEDYASPNPFGLDVAAIEHMDARSLAVVREDGVDRKLNITIRPDTAVMLLIEIELRPADRGRDLWPEFQDALEDEAPDTPVRRLSVLLDEWDALDRTEIAMPSDERRARAFAELREAVPAGVNRRVALAQQQIDPRISKTAADMIVPFDRFADMMRICRRLFAERGLDLAVWGHISDGNVHPNVIPRSADEVRMGQDAILALGAEVIRMGGCPLAEHGVGRSTIKQELLRLLYGDAGVAAMRAIKLSLDPQGLLAPGVIFPSQ
jgi:D-lactate dehydrogenase (cytochrome)